MILKVKNPPAGFRKTATVLFGATARVAHKTYHKRTKIYRLAVDVQAIIRKEELNVPPEFFHLKNFSEPQLQKIFVHAKSIAVKHAQKHNLKFTPINTFINDVFGSKSGVIIQNENVGWVLFNTKKK